MWCSILCLSFVTAVSAAPVSPFFNYLPHYGNQAGPSAQPAFNAPISMEIVFPQRFQGTPVGGAGNGAASFPTQGFIKYSLPKAPGRKSIEIYYPYDFTQQQMMPNVPVLPQIPPLPGLVTFDNPAQTSQNQAPRAGSAQPNGPHPQILHDQLVQPPQTGHTGQAPTHP